MTSIKLVLLQAVLCVTLVYGRSTGHRWSDPSTSIIFISKASLNGKTLHRLTESRQIGTEWDQVTGENKASGELSFFTAYTRSFPEEDIGTWLDPEYIGGFTRKMRVCKMRHSDGDDMYLLTSQGCENFAASGRIWEEFNFYVSSYHRSQYSTIRIYYASCQESETSYSYVKISKNQIGCGRDNRINRGSFYAQVPEGYACEYLSAPDGTTVNYEYERGRISGARLSCNPGYQIRGNTDVECGTNGRWMGSPSTCEPITCGNPRVTDSQMYVETSGPYNFGDWVKFKCRNGYEIFPPDASANCQSNGNWFYQQAECRPVDCKFPGEPRFGSTIADNGYELGAEITFECNRGYRLEGSDWAVCADTGRWDPPGLPTCREVRCPRLPQPENGRHHGSDSRFVMGQEVIFQCDSGYSLVGEQILKCEFGEELQTGVWSADMPVCSQVRCQPPTVPENGAILGSDYSYGAQISFRCDVGFTKRGSDVATCQNNGEWDAQPPTCHVMQCRDPRTPEHATRSGNSFTYGSVLTYRCNVGYRRSGSKTLVCGENGRWTTTPPTCEPVGCPEMSAPLSGSKEGDSFVYGSKIEFSCFPGYQLIGANETECLSNGRWSEEKPECEACAYGFYKAEAGTGRCQRCPERSYTTSEASNSRQQCICEADTHGPPGGPCEAVRCVYPAVPEHGEIKECGTENNDLCIFSCDPGYILQGSRSRTCTSQGWTGHLPVCTACPTDTFKRDEGSLSCTPCPQNTHIPEGTLGTTADSCVCRSGFQRGSGGQCEDIDECAVENGGCEDHCENTPGSYKCKCTTGGYELNEDGHTCYQAQTCSELEESPNNGYLTCRKYEETNGVTCGIKCNPGYFFVSGINDYVTCGVETSFEWSHKLVNKTARIPSCTEEFFVDVLLPVKSTYKSEFSCDALQFSPDHFFERMRVQQIISTLHQCIDSSASGRFCEAKNLTLDCEDVTNDDGTVNAEITVGFNVLLKNKEEGAVHPSCEDSCKRESLRGMLGNAVNLTKELEQLIKDKAIGIDTGSGSPTPVENTGMERVRPKLLCLKEGRVLTKYRLCVPCDKGYYLPDREMEQCIPCPKGTYQDNQSQTSCKPCLSGSTTLQDGSTGPFMCNVQVTDYQVNGTSTQTELNMGGEEEGEGDVDLDSFGVAF